MEHAKKGYRLERKSVASFTLPLHKVSITMKTLLIVAHAPSENTQLMAEAVLKGARHSDIEQVSISMQF